MYFKLTYRVLGLLLPRDASFTFRIKGQVLIDVRIRFATVIEVARGAGELDAFCDATAAFSVSDKNMDILIEHAKGDEKHKRSVYDQPEHFQSCYTNIRNELHAAINATVGILRWRCNDEGPHNPLSFRSMLWSENGTDWQAIPSEISGVPEGRGPLRLSNDEKAEVEMLANQLDGEPVYHELFREAWSQRHENRRSAIVIGLSAAEVAVKQAIGKLVPDAKWLAEEVPSPPLANIVREYLPQLPAKNTINGKVLPPPQSVIDIIAKKGTPHRNKIAHVGRRAPKRETVEEILLAVRDLLWLIDYYCGHGWALNYVRDETKAAMGIETGDLTGS